MNTDYSYCSGVTCSIRKSCKRPRTFKGEWVAGFNIHRSPSDKEIVGFPLYVRCR